MSSPQQPNPEQPEPQEPNQHQAPQQPAPQQPHQYQTPQYQAQPQQPLNPSDERLYSTLVHIGGIFFSFVPALIAYLVLKDRGPFIREHSVTALNFQLTVAIAYIVGSVLLVILVGAFILLAAGIASIVFGILAAIAANKGERYTYPMAIKFVS